MLRPVIDEFGPRLVDDHGRTVEGVKSWKAVYNSCSVLRVVDVEFIAMWPDGPKARSDV